MEVAGNMNNFSKLINIVNKSPNKNNILKVVGRKSPYFSGGWIALAYVSKLLIWYTNGWKVVE